MSCPQRKLASASLRGNSATCALCSQPALVQHTAPPLQDIAGPAKRAKTFVSTIHSMGLLPLQQTAPVVVPQLQPQPDGATGYGGFTERQRLSLISSTPVASRLSAAPEQLRNAERHITVPPLASQHVHDHQVAVHSACLLPRLFALPWPLSDKGQSAMSTLLLLGCYGLLTFHTLHVLLPCEVDKQPSSKTASRTVYYCYFNVRHFNQVDLGPASSASPSCTACTQLVAVIVMLTSMAPC